MNQQFEQIQIFNTKYAVNMRADVNIIVNSLVTLRNCRVPFNLRTFLSKRKHTIRCYLSVNTETMERKLTDNAQHFQKFVFHNNFYDLINGVKTDDYLIQRYCYYNVRHLCLTRRIRARIQDFTDFLLLRHFCKANLYVCKVCKVLRKVILLYRQILLFKHMKDCS